MKRGGQTNWGCGSKGGECYYFKYYLAILDEGKLPGKVSLNRHI